MLENFKETYNKIWSDDSLLNNSYDRSLCEKAIANPEGELKYNRLERAISPLTEESTGKAGRLREKIGLWFEKVGLTLSSLKGSSREKINGAFKTVEKLKAGSSEETYKVGIQTLKHKEISEKLSSFDKAIGTIDQQLSEIKGQYHSSCHFVDLRKESLDRMKEKHSENAEQLKIIDKFPEDRREALRASLQEEQYKLNSQIASASTALEEAQFEVKSLESRYVSLSADKKKQIEDKEKFEVGFQLKPKPEVSPELPFDKEKTLGELRGEKSEVEESESSLFDLNKEIRLKGREPSLFGESEATELLPSVSNKADATQEAPPTEAPKTQEVTVQAEPPKLSNKELMLKDIKDNMGEGFHKIWKGLVDKFDANIVKSWSFNPNGEFKLELNKPMRLWIPSTDPDTGEKDPSNGVVLVLGTDENGKPTNEISGKLIKGSMDFSKGFQVFVKPDNKFADAGYAAMTNISDSGNGILSLKSEKDLTSFRALTLRFLKPIIERYGILKDGKLIVDKQRPLVNLAKNWNEQAQVIETEQDYWKTQR